MIIVPPIPFLRRRKAAAATAGAGNGIVAVDDGGTWEGASGLGLPFG